MDYMAQLASILTMILQMSMSILFADLYLINKNNWVIYLLGVGGFNTVIIEEVTKVRKIYKFLKQDNNRVLEQFRPDWLLLFCYGLLSSHRF